MEYKRIADSKTEIFLQPIPKWITTYGFVTLVVIALAIVGGSSLVRIPKTVQVQVRFTSSQILAEVPIQDFSNWATGEVVIGTPFGEIDGVLKLTDFWVEGSSIYIPVEIERSMADLRFKQEMRCTGEITLERVTLFDKIFHRTF